MIVKRLQRLVSTLLPVAIIFSLTTLPVWAYERGISIPALNFYSDITTFPLMNGTWQIAADESLVGHLEHTAWIGDNDNIILAGHVRYNNGADGVFAIMYNLSIGQEIILTENGIEQHYQITEIKIVDEQDISIIFPDQGHQLTLLTCHLPSYNPLNGTYDQCLVVIARPV